MANGEAASRQRVPRYDDEDTSPTTDKELRGWYAYGIAAEVFAVCGVGKSCLLCNSNIEGASANRHEQALFSLSL